MLGLEGLAVDAEVGLGLVLEVLLEYVLPVLRLAEEDLLEAVLAG